MSVTANDIRFAENFLAQGDMGTALPLLENLRAEAEEEIASSCETTDDTQYFSFADAFERLAYRRVENDPRELVQVEVPYDRLYSDLAFAYIRSQRYAEARDALMQAVRWNPMNCGYRLDLAELFRAFGDKQEWAALSHSVLERAADPGAAARAYANLGRFFLDEDNVDAAIACARLARNFAADDERTVRLVDDIAARRSDWEDAPDAQVFAELELQGVPTALNADIAVCLIMCATDAAAAGDTDEATRLTVRARDLVGADAAKALIKLIRESDAELARERSAGPSEAAVDASETDTEPAGENAPTEEDSHA